MLLMFCHAFLRTDASPRVAVVPETQRGWMGIAFRRGKEFEQAIVFCSHRQHGWPGVA